jgi:hypothetical protein
MRRKIVNNMYLLLPQNVLRVETLGFWPFTKRVHLVPVSKYAFSLYSSSAMCFLSSYSLLLTGSVSEPKGLTGETNRKLADLVSSNLAQHLEGVEILRMRTRKTVCSISLFFIY